MADGEPNTETRLSANGVFSPFCEQSPKEGTSTFLWYLMLHRSGSLEPAARGKAVKRRIGGRRVAVVLLPPKENQGPSYRSPTGMLALHLQEQRSGNTHKNPNLQPATCSKRRPARGCGRNVLVCGAHTHTHTHTPPPPPPLSDAPPCPHKPQQGSRQDLNNLQRISRSSAPFAYSSATPLTNMSQYEHRSTGP